MSGDELDIMALIANELRCVQRDEASRMIKRALEALPENDPARTVLKDVLFQRLDELSKDFYENT